MIVCHCEGWTDRDLRRLARGPRPIEAPAGAPAGASGACSAGRSCGGCLALVLRILAEEQRAAREEAGPDALGRAG